MFPITRACDDGTCQSVYVMDLITCPVLSCAYAPTRQHDVNLYFNTNLQLA